jgi:hypothetical protein
MNKPKSHSFTWTLVALAFAIVLLVLGARYGRAATEWPTQRSQGENGAPAYGVNFITSAEETADEQKFQNGVSTGAGWDRWPIYWFHVEQAPGAFNWASQDTAAHGDVLHGLKTNAILLGTPEFYRTEPTSPAAPAGPEGSELSLPTPQTGTPVGLYEAIFNDGTDIPGPGKQINPTNVWARFVYETVNRYKPGGVLAQANGWPAGAGITHWEMWNEPDFPFFWDGTVGDYARLLKVGYLAAEQADANAQILFGGLANYHLQPNFYEDVLAIFDGDPMAAGFNYFHDILATHSYSHAFATWTHVQRAANSQVAHGLNKPIWLNETGVPAWDDYPGPVWDPSSPLRATMEEQAAYVVQTTFYAAYAGADAIFHFQLYDACGNQPAGSDFPPHNGELCGDPNYPVCAGDANGLFRNPSDAVCFTQHPQPETPRPNYTAYQLLTSHFQGVEPLWWIRPGDPVNGRQEWLAFYRPATNQRMVGMWARFGTDETAVIPATSSSGLLIGSDGVTQTVTAVGGHYNIVLPAATNQNAFWDPELYMIGGRSYILIETDTLAPQISAYAPSVSEGPIPLVWSGNDGLGGGVANFDVSVSIDGGTPELWLAGTTSTYAVFPGELFHAYTFYVVARDRAGNGSEPAVLVVQTMELPYDEFMPFMTK